MTLTLTTTNDLAKTRARYHSNTQTAPLQSHPRPMFESVSSPAKSRVERSLRGGASARNHWR